MAWRPILTALAAALALAVLAGYLSSIYSLKLILLILAGVALSWSIIRWPRWGLVLIITFMSTLLAPGFFYSIVDPKLIYYSQEILLLLIVASSLIYRVRNHKKAGIFQRLNSSPLMIALTIFLAIVLIKALVVMIERRFALGSISSMYDFNRGITFFLLAIPALLLLDNRERLRWMTGVLFFLGTVVIVRVLLELIFPKWGIWQYITVAEPLATETPSVDLSVQRLRTPGGTIMLACFWTGVMSIILQPWTVKRLAFYLPFTLAMLTGLILEFNRSYILPMAGLLVLSTLFNRKNARIKLLTLAAVAVLAVVTIAAFTGTMQKYIDAAGSRFGSALSSQSLESQSVNSRWIEQDYAFQAIGRAPLFGIGLDELYRPPVPGMQDNLRWYIHNSYLWFWTYFGLVGLAAFLGVIFTAIFRSAFNWRRTSDPLLQAVLLGLAFSLATLLAANFAAPKFYDYATVPMVALMLGMIEAIILSERRGDPALQ
ncbi:MAG: O-antigen ligase family protein [Thermoleophilia bacterium]